MPGLWRNPFVRASPKESQPHNVGHQQGRERHRGMFVRLANGKRVEIPGAEYVQSMEGGKVLFLDENRQVLRELPWVDVVAHGRIK